ncbi:MAG: iron ABC transporter permease [Muribaculaceae bacterium]|nr:iron ABC transporter permease [Muribaculaceae bacterium]
MSEWQENKDCFQGRNVRYACVFITLIVLTVILFVSLLVFGAVSFPLAEVIDALSGGADLSATSTVIVRQARIPMAVASLLTGAALSVAGLMLQTTFRNQLAGPSILGVSAGASLGVAIVMMGASALGISSLSPLSSVSSIIGSLVGAGGIILLLVAFSSYLKNPVMLLIVGVLTGYLASSFISLLNYFAPSDDVKSFVMWGMGSFSAVRTDQLLIMVVPILLALVATFMMAKPLNALLLGERYAASMGYSVKSLRTILLALSGLLTAVVTAFCGPIGFIGLVVPHIARLLTGTSNHVVLIPATILSGSAIMLLCTLCTVFPSAAGVLPINVVTPVIGVPVIVYVILKGRKI